MHLSWRVLQIGDWLPSTLPDSGASAVAHERTLLGLEVLV